MLNFGTWLHLCIKISIDYQKWLPEWKRRRLFARTLPIVPKQSQYIWIYVSAWCYFLHGHPDRDLVHFFLQTISESFRVKFNYQHCTLKSATSHPSVVEDYLKTEVKLSRVAGPLTLSSMPWIHYNRFAKIINPKNGGLL